MKNIAQRIQETDNIINEIKCIIATLDVDLDPKQRMTDLALRIDRLINAY